MAGGQKFRQPFLLGYGHVFRFNSDCSSLRCFPAGSDPLPSRGQECLSSDAHSCAFHFLVRLRVITDVGEEDAAGFLDQQVAGLQREALGAATANWSISQDFHCGGYARRPAELTEFVADFEARHGITLDWVYVAKMLRGIFLLAAEQAIRPGTTAVALITGPAR